MGQEHGGLQSSACTESSEGVLKADSKASIIGPRWGPGISSQRNWPSSTPTHIHIMTNGSALAFTKFWVKVLPPLGSHPKDSVSREREEEEGGESWVVQRGSQQRPKPTWSSLGGNPQVGH